MTEPYIPGAPAQQSAPVPQPVYALQAAIGQSLAQGWRLEQSYGTTAVMVTGRRPNNALHGVLTLVTGGFWGVIWLAEVIGTHERRLVLTADEYGRVSQQLAKTGGAADLVGPVVGLVIAATLVTLYLVL